MASIRRLDPGGLATPPSHASARPQPTATALARDASPLRTSRGLSSFELAPLPRERSLPLVEPGLLFAGHGGVMSPAVREAARAASGVSSGAPALPDTLSTGEALAQGAAGVFSQAQEVRGLIAGPRIAETAARGLARFTPGLDVAMAGVDIAEAVRIISDPDASLTDKITSGITAFGSCLAATNIPIVSQIGAGISAVASVVGSVFDGIKHVAEDIGKGIKGFFEGIGNGIKHLFGG